MGSSSIRPAHFGPTLAAGALLTAGTADSLVSVPVVPATAVAVALSWPRWGVARLYRDPNRRQSGGGEHSFDRFVALLGVFPFVAPVVERQAGLEASMSRAANCYDNAAMESFWRTLKGELTQRRAFATREKPAPPSSNTWSLRQLPAPPQMPCISPTRTCMKRGS